jgi:hypothetical protein
MVAMVELVIQFSTHQQLTQAAQAIREQAQVLAVEVVVLE